MMLAVAVPDDLEGVDYVSAAVLANRAVMGAEEPNTETVPLMPTEDTLKEVVLFPTRPRTR